MSDKILEVKNLKKYFKVKAGVLHAVDDVSFHIDRGETLGLVGESGCGKSTTGRAILRLHEPTAGDVIFEGESILHSVATGKRRCARTCRSYFRIPIRR